MQTLRFEVDNVKCDGCAKAIRSGVAALAGVISVDVDVAAGVVSVSAESAAQDEIAATLKDLGYPVKA